MITPKQRAEEAKLNIDGQWFVRGNRSATWIALNSRPDGSAGGIAEKIPQEVWPILERVAELEAQAAEHEADNERAFQQLEIAGVPKERARNIANGIGVLVTRFDRAHADTVSSAKAERDAAVAEAIERAAKVCFDVVLQWQLPLPVDDRMSTDIRNQIATAIRALKPRSDMVSAAEADKGA